MTYARTTSLVRRRHRDVRTYRVGGPGYRRQTVVRLRRMTFTTLAVLTEHRIGAARPSAAVAVGQRSQIWCPKEEPGVLGGCKCGCVVHGRRHADIGEESEIEAAVSVGVRCARAGPRISSASGTLPPPRVPLRALRPRIKTQKLIIRQRMG